MADVPITYGTGQASIASETISGRTFQQIKVIDGTVSSTNTWKINSDGSAQVSILGTPSFVQSGTVISSISGTVTTTFSGSPSISGAVTVVGTPAVSVQGTVFASIIGTPSISGTVNIGNQVSVVGSIGLTGTPSISGAVTVVGNPSVSGTVGASVIGRVPTILVDSNNSVLTTTQNGADLALDVNISQITVAATNPLGVTGPVASGSTDSGNPIKIGGVFNTTQPSVSSGQRINAAFTSKGAMIIANGADGLSASVFGTVSINPASVSGTVGASIIGTIPMTMGPGTFVTSVVGNVGLTGTPSISGAVTVVGNPSISGTVNIGITPGSVVAFQGGTRITSVSGVVNTSGSIAGTYTEPAVVSSVTGVAMMFKTNINTSTMGAVSATNPLPVTFGATSNQSVSGTVGASIIGTVPMTMGPGTFVTSVVGTVATTQSGGWTTSVVGGPITLYAPSSSYVSGVTSVFTTTTSVTVLSGAPGGQRNYITHILATNGGAVGTYVNIYDAGQVVYAGYCAASGGGFSATLPAPIRQSSAQGALCAAMTATSSVVVAVSGYTAT